MTRFAETTEVPVARSRQEIDRLLREWGCDGLAWADDFRAGEVCLRFIWSRDEARYLARINLKLPTDEALRPKAMDRRTHRLSEPKLKKLQDARGRREFRVLLLWLRAALNAVDTGIVTAEAVFLPFLEGQDGRTVAEVAVPRMRLLLTGSAGALLDGEGMEVEGT